MAPLISILIPHWNRNELLAKTLASLEKYNAEIVVVDDGSDNPPDGAVRLPKSGPLNPCVPFNVAARHAKGEVFVLTNPEVSHPEPILGDMLAELESLGPKGYVAAACWDIGKKRWLCHSTVSGENAVGTFPQPPESGLHFCAMLYASFYRKIGGFDEKYRYGQAFDDNDLLWTLHKHGAKFSVRDDLVVEHRSVGVKWPAGGHARNMRIFKGKWGFGDYTVRPRG